MQNPGKYGNAQMYMCMKDNDNALSVLPPVEYWWLFWSNIIKVCILSIRILSNKGNKKSHCYNKIVVVF